MAIIATASSIIRSSSLYSVASIPSKFELAIYPTSPPLPSPLLPIRRSLQPPEMRLAQFARSSTVNDKANLLYGLPEMEVVARSTSSVSDASLPSDHPANNHTTPRAKTSLSAVGAPGGDATVTESGGSATTITTTPLENMGGAGFSPEDSSSPTMGPTLTPARFRYRAGEALGGYDGVEPTGRRASGRKSGRSSGTSGASTSPLGAGGVVAAAGVFSAAGMGAEAAAQAFTEEAELEALQIDKNDLKLVFGRPFARGKSSEVYQVTHAGKNRAAKVQKRD